MGYGGDIISFDFGRYGGVIQLQILVGEAVVPDLTFLLLGDFDASDYHTQLTNLYNLRQLREKDCTGQLD